MSCAPGTALGSMQKNTCIVLFISDPIVLPKRPERMCQSKRCLGKGKRTRRGHACALGQSHQVRSDWRREENRSLKERQRTLYIVKTDLHLYFCTPGQ